MKQRALAATGLVATAAAGGMGVAAVTAAEAQAASGVVHACYSKSTHALKFSKGTKCPKGAKLVTWNKQGLQGVTGAPGAQGPAGPAVGYANERFGVRSDFSANTKFIAASFTPASAGYFAVDGNAAIEPFGTTEYYCWDQGGGGTTSTANETTSGIFSPESSDHSFTIPTGGIIAAGPTEPVYEVCSGGHSGRYLTGYVLGIHLNSAHATLVNPPARRGGASNRFNKKK